MKLFAKKAEVYSAKGKKSEWKAVKEKLKLAGIHPYASVYEDEVPVCSCGAQMDVRDYGKNGRIDRNVYQINVLAEDGGKASEIIAQMLPDYRPYNS